MKTLIFNNRRNMLLLTILFGLFSKAIIVYFLKVEPYSDYTAYMNMAESMLATGNMNDGFGNIAFYSAGYPLFLVPFFYILGATPETAQFANVILGGLSVFLVFLCAEKIGLRWRLSILAAFIWAIYPPSLLYTEYVAKENLMTVLLLLQVFLVLRHSSTKSKKTNAILLGIIFGLGMLTGPAIILTGLISAISITFIWKSKHNDSSKINIIPLTTFVLAFLVTISPWLYYTNTKLGTPILNLNGGFNLYLGNNPNSEIFFKGISSTPIKENWHHLKETQGEVKAFSHLKELAIEYIKDNPFKTASLAIQKIVVFWLPPFHTGESGKQSLSESLVRFAWLISYCLILCLAGIPLLNYKKLDQETKIIYLILLAYCLVHGLAYIIFRYRLPIIPLLIIVAVQGINILQKNHTHKNKTLT